jgi:pimeloyl-ACP methyl ester carboxylesterase
MDEQWQLFCKFSKNFNLCKIDYEASNVDQVNKKINYQMAGEEGTTVILIHGIPSSLDEWEFLIPELVSAGYRTFSLDLLGHGGSYQPEDPACYTVDSAYELFEEWLASLNLDGPIVLIGHSFGGHLAIKYALNHPDKVRGLILIGPFLSYTQLRRTNRVLFSHPALSAFLYPLIPAWLIKAFVWSGSLKMERFQIRSSLSSEELAKMAAGYLRCSPNVVYFLGSVNDEAYRYAEIEAPTLLIWGKNDATLSTSWYKEMVSKLPKWTYNVINAGHYPHRSNYEEVNALILEFLKSNFI